MSDSPEPQPQSQPVQPEPTHTSAGLAPPSAFGDSLHVRSEEGSTLPRNVSTASFGPEACHVEDIASGCGNEHAKHSILHSATHTPALSRNPSSMDVTHASAAGGKGVHESSDLVEENEEEGEDDDSALEMKALNVNGHSGTLFEAILCSSNPACDIIDSGYIENDQIDPSTATSQISSTIQEEGLHSSPPPVPETSGAEEHQLVEKPQDTPAAPETTPVEAAAIIASPPTPSEPVQEQQAVESNPDPVLPVSEHPETKGNINWEFDDMSALQAHVAGPDPFEQLRQEAPARSSTFPPVPPHDESLTTAHYDNEKALFNMMASEVATGEGERGIFDSPSAEQGGFFGAPDEGAGRDPFSSISPGETIDDNVEAMMGQVLDAAGVGGLAPGAEEDVEDEDARFEEGVPLINHSTEGTKEEPDLFSDTDIKEGDGFFGGLAANGEDKFVPGPERKSTVQVVEGATHPYHSAEGVAASMATVASLVLGSDDLSTEEKVSLFDALPSPVVEGGDDFFSQIGKQSQEPEAEKTAEEEDDLTARWKAALAGDVLDDEEGFLPSDDEGFLPDSDDESPPKMASIRGDGGQLQGFSTLSTGSVTLAKTQSPSIPQQPPGRYTPQNAQHHAPPAQPPYGGAAWQQPSLQQMPLNPYAPPQPTPFPPNTAQAYFNQPSATSPYAAFGAKTPTLPQKKAQSFVDKKEGYQSPYDLPMDVAPPIIRKRPSNLGPQGPTTPGLPPPARTSSIGTAFLPAGALKPRPQPQKFFEELPIAPPKPRTVSAMGMGGRYSPNPANQLPPRSAGGFAPLPGPQRPGSTQGFYSHSPQQTFAQPVMGSPQQAFAQPSIANTRYSPAPRQASSAYAPPSAPISAPALQGYQPPPVAPGPIPNADVPYAPAMSTPPAVPPKYAPRPAGPPQMARPPTGTAGFVAPPKSVGGRLPQGDTSPPQAFVQPQQNGSPLQQVSPTSHFQSPQEDTYHIAQRRFSGDHHGMHSSRPGTARSVSLSTTMDVPREEEEEEAVDDSSVSHTNGYPSSAPLPSQNRYAPSRGPGTPTPGQISRANTFTPPPGVTQSPRYTSQLPDRTMSPGAPFQPPPRAQTQSPGMAFGRSNKIAQRPRDPYERPSSAFAHTSTYSHSSLDLHQRAQSLQLNFMTPNDETGRDVLKRWQGAPLFTWGFGGNVAVMFPRRAQRYTSDMQQPMIKCSPGEVKIKNIKEILPLEENEGKFPGPAWTGGKNKGRKKDVLAWMGGKIEALEREIEGQGKRAEEKLLLWKVVRALLENDGVLEGNPEVEKVVRGVLTPEVVSEDSGINGGGSFTMVGDISANMQGPSADRADPEAVRNIKMNLLKGDRTAAVWHAADKRLWSHALLIAGTVGKDLWKQVVQEFVKHEVKPLGEGVESLAVLYEIFAGNWAESVDELVSASTRVGIPMLGGAPNGEVNVEEKLDRWRETLGLVLNNRSPGDAEAILALGKLLVAYGRIEAGHIWYILRSPAYSSVADWGVASFLLVRDLWVVLVLFWEDMMTQRLISRYWGWRVELTSHRRIRTRLCSLRSTSWQYRSLRHHTLHSRTCYPISFTVPWCARRMDTSRKRRSMSMLSLPLLRVGENRQFT